MISIIIPVYNAGKSIEACLSSLRRQSVPSNSYEIIIVDDGSTDGGVEKPGQRGVRVIRQHNQGPAVARNSGTASAKGDILLFIDADCVAHTNWIEEMLKPFNDPAVVGVVGAYKTHQSGLVPQFIQLEFEERYRKYQQRETVDCAASHSAGFRRKVFLDMGGFSPSLLMNEDVDLSYRISHKGGKIIFNPGAIVYHQHPKTIRKYFITKFWRGYWRAIVYLRYPKKAVSDSYTPQMLKLQVFMVYILLFSLFMSLFYTRAMIIGGASILFSSLSMGKFCIDASRHSLKAGIISMPLLWTRAIAIALGAASGIIATALRRGEIT
jgi:glycosyltransferase involved in cell wall biosynthesis